MPHRSNVIPFPTTPPFARPRKPGAVSDVEKKHHIATNLPALMPSVAAQIVNRWRRGTQIAFLAKEFQLTQRQTESVIWCADHHEWETRRAA